MDEGAERLSPSHFPPLLREIPDAPEKLRVRGALPSPEEYRYLCVVGSRAAGEYARRACASLIRGLSGYPVVIVSGLALGIDAAAHEAAMAAGLTTIAVLPSGLDEGSIYPSLNRPLAARILKNGGALVSEYERGWKPQIWCFPARNRIMEGISHATLIVEAGEKSGTLITARLALEYNREVLAVPHPLGSERGAGNNRLIREGAALVRGSEDILEALGIAPRNAEGKELPQDLTEAERALVGLLTGPLTRDELIEESGLSARDANIALSSLSIRGLVVERMGKVERG